MSEVHSLDRQAMGNDQIVISYDANNNAQYVGQSRPGAATSDSLWRIKLLTYNASNLLTNVQWPGGSPAYGFVWDNRSTYTYS